MRFKWVAYCHDWAYEDKSKTTFGTERECYDDMRNAVLEKMKWNTEHDDDYLEATDNYTDGISYEVHFAKKMIVHSSYSGTYVYLMLEEHESDSYFDVFSKERVEELKGLGYLDSWNIATIENYRAVHEVQVKKEQEEREKAEREKQENKERERFCEDIKTKIAEVEQYMELRKKVQGYWEYLEESLGEPMWPMDEDWKTEEGCRRMLAVMDSINGNSKYLANYGDWTADGERDTKDYMRTDGKTWGQVWRENLKFFAEYHLPLYERQFNELLKYEGKTAEEIRASFAKSAIANDIEGEYIDVNYKDILDTFVFNKDGKAVLVDSIEMYDKNGQFIGAKRIVRHDNC